jgi:hypothetical protein
MRKAVPFLLIALVLSVTMVFAQDPIRKVVDVPKVDPATMTIDGKMDETAWSTAAHADVITPAGFEVWCNYYGRTVTQPDYDAIYGRMLWADDTLYLFIHVDEIVNDSTNLYFAGSHYGEPGAHWKSDQIYVGISNRLGIASWSGWEGAAYTMPDGPYHLMIMGDYVTFNDGDSLDVPEDYRQTFNFAPTRTAFNAADIIRWGVVTDTTTGVWDVEMAIYQPNVRARGQIGFNLAGSASAKGLDDSYGYWIWQPNVPDDPFADPLGTGWNTYYIQQNSKVWALLNFLPGTTDTVITKSVDVPYVAPDAITIDGKMDEPSWSGAAHADVITPAGYEVWCNYYGRTVTQPDYDAIYGRMLWTDDTLYVFMHIDEIVNDSTKLYFAGTHYGEPGAHWKSDQLYVGLSNRLGIQSWSGWEGAAWNTPDGPFHLMIMGDYVTFNDGDSMDIPVDQQARIGVPRTAFPASNTIRSAVVTDTTTGIWDVEMAIYHPSVTSQSSLTFNVAGSASSPGLDDSYGYWIWQPNTPDDPFADPVGTGWNTYYIQQNSSRFATLNFKGNIVGVNDPKNLATLPTAFSLSQNYPNPFNPATKIAYDLPRAAKVSLVVVNVLGQKVATLADDARAAGHYEATWNATNVSTGVYFVQLRVDNNIVATRKMMLLK